MVGFQGIAIRVSEGDRKFFRNSSKVLGECDGGEIQTSAGGKLYISLDLLKVFMEM